MHDASPAWVDRGLTRPLLALGFGAVAASVYAPGLIDAAGVAPFALAAVVALLIGAPLASLRAGTSDPASAPVARATDHTLRAAMGAALAWPLAQPAGTGDLGQLGLAAVAVVGAGVVLAWVPAMSMASGDGAGMSTGTRRTLAAWTIGLVTAWGALRVLEGFDAGAPADPWTALLPAWRPTTAWWPQAVLLGLALPALGSRTWTGMGRRGARAARLPFLTAGVGVWLMLAIVGVLAMAYPGAFADAGGPVWSHLVLSACGAAWLLARSPADARNHRLAEIIAWGVWFLVAGTTAVTWMWWTLLPFVLGISLAPGARQGPDVSRALHGVGAAGFVVCGIVAFPGMPEGMWPAAACALTVVGLVWRTGWSDITQEAA